MQFRSVGHVVALCLLTISCNHNNGNHLNIATGPPGTSNYEIGNIVAEVLAKNPLYQVGTETGEDGSLARVQLLLSGRADFAMIQNDLHLAPEAEASLRTVAHLYPQVLFIVYRGQAQTSSLVELIRGKTLGVGPRHSGVQGFVKNLLTEFGVDTNACRFVYTSYDDNKVGDSIDVSFALTGFNNRHVLDQTHRGGRIWSFDTVDQLGKGTSAEGFCMKYPYAKPYVLPLHLYGEYPMAPLLTLAIDNILVTRASTDPIVVYDVVKQLYENREMLTNRSVLFSGMVRLEDAMNVATRFPAHEGTRMYLERDRPSFFERYAEVFGLIVTIITVFASAVFGIVQLRNLRSERRRDKYHFKLFDLQRRLEFTYDLPGLMELEKELRALWKIFLTAADNRQVHVDSEFHALRNAFKETEDELYEKKRAAEERES